MPPGINEVHVSAPLTNLAIQFRNPAFVASEIFPVIPVKHEADKYYKFLREELRRVNSLRAVGARSKEVKWGVTEGTYKAEEYALSALVADRIIANSDVAIRPEMNTTNKLMKWIMLDYESRVQAIAQDTSKVGGSHVPTIKWDGGGTVTIEADVDTGKQAMRRGAGVIPNKIVMNAEVKDVVKKDSTVRNLIRYTMPAASGLLTDGELPPVLWNMKTVVAGSVEDTANEGQDASISDVWNDNVVLVFVDAAPSLDALTFGFTMRVRQGGKLDAVTTKWREPGRKGNFVEPSVIQAEEVCAAECAYIIADTLS